MNSQVGARLQKVREELGETQKSMARILGLGESTWQKCELAGRLPRDEALHRLAELGVSVDWLLSGRGSMWSTPAETSNARPATAPFDEELHALVVDGVMAVYKEEGAGLPPRDLGRLAARIHGDLVAAYNDPDERKLALKLALQQLRRDLHAAPAADQGKRLA